MAKFGGLALSPSLKEKQLLRLLDGRKPEDLGLPEQVRAAQVLGSLELSGFSYPFEEVLAAGRGGEGSSPLVGLFRGLDAVASDGGLTVEALLKWHAAVLGGASSLREEERSREGTAPAPPQFILSRLKTLEEWFQTNAVGELKPAQLAALGMARIVEILPFSDGNGRVSRLAASHLMKLKGAEPPILVKADERALKEALAAAFSFETEPLASLLEEASHRALDVMLQSLEVRGF